MSIILTQNFHSEKGSQGLMLPCGTTGTAGEGAAPHFGVNPAGMGELGYG